MLTARVITRSLLQDIYFRRDSRVISLAIDGWTLSKDVLAPIAPRLCLAKGAAMFLIIHHGTTGDVPRARAKLGRERRGKK